jgi:hypothetical protein
VTLLLLLLLLLLPLGSYTQVANKVVEMLMMRSGIDVCCTSDEDVQRLERLSSTDSTG